MQWNTNDRGEGGGGGVAESTASVSEKKIYVWLTDNVDDREVSERGWMRDWVRTYRLYHEVEVST